MALLKKQSTDKFIELMVESTPFLKLISFVQLNEPVCSCPLVTLARYKTLYGGLMVALDKKTGEEIWRLEMPHYAWSSPVDFYNENGKGYIIQCDSIGNIHLIDGATGNILDTINLGANIESSPAIFEDTIVIATRGGKIFGIKIE